MYGLALSLSIVLKTEIVFQRSLNHLQVSVGKYVYLFLLIRDINFCHQ